MDAEFLAIIAENREGHHLNTGELEVAVCIKPV